MRGIKSFFMSGMVLCVLYLIMQSTFFSNVLFNQNAQTSNGATQNWYSRFNLPLSADAEQAEAPVEETPAETPTETPAEAPAETPAETPAPAAEEKKEEAPAAAAPAPTEEPKKEEAPAAAPAEAKPAEAEKKEEEKPEVEGIDTVDLKEPAGNWLLKRKWWTAAQERYSQIKDVFDQIHEARMPFYTRRAKIDRDVLEPLYIHAGLDRSDLIDVLSKFNTLLDVEQEKHKALDEQDQAMQAKALAQKKVLEDLQKDVTDLAQYDVGLDEFLNTLMEQINAARSYQNKAWQAYVNIGNELNDKRAHDLYYEMVSYLEGATAIQGYINGDFQKAFTQLEKTVAEQAKRITDTLTSLKESNIDFKEYSQKLDEKIQNEGKTEEPEAAPEEPEQEGFMGMLMSWWNMIKDAFVSAYDWVMSFFSGSSDAAAETPESTSSSDTAS